MKRFKFLIWKYLLPWYQKKFSIQVAQSPEDKEKIYKFRYEVYQNEFHYYSEEENLKLNGMVHDLCDDSENTIILMASVNSEIIGTLRLTVWEPNTLPAAIQDKYYLTAIENINNIKVAELRLFLIKDEYRKGNLAISLFSTLYSIWKKQPALLPDVIFADCMPGLIYFYQKLGGFLYSRNIIPSYFGVMVPIVFEPLNDVRLKQNQCITYRLAKAISRAPTQASPFVKEISLALSESEISSRFSKHLSSYKSKELRFLLQYSEYPLVISVPAESKILKSNTLDYDLYWILEGAVGIYQDQCLIAQLQQGDLFGEMALLDQHHKRFNDVVSLTETQILLIPRNLLNRMIAQDPSAAIAFMKILGASLSSKINSMNSLIYELKCIKR